MIYTILEVAALYQRKLKKTNRNKANNWLYKLINEHSINGALYIEGRDTATWCIQESFDDEGNAINFKKTSFIMKKKQP